MPVNPRTNPLALAVLVCLYERPMHPYEVAQTLKHRAKHESVRLNYGSLYGVVEGLEKRGYIRAAEVVRDGRRPERTIYEITDTGAREMVDWLSALITTPAKEYLQFQAALSFVPALPPDEVIRLLSSRVKELETALAFRRILLDGLRQQRLPRLFVLEEEYMGALQEAELDFVRRLVKELQDGSFEDLELWQSFSRGERLPPQEW